VCARSNIARLQTTDIARRSTTMGFNDTFIGRYFKMNDRKTTLGTEIVAGLSTFLTLAYILAVNPAILADSGGTCHTCTDYPNDSDCIPNQFQPFFLPAIFTPAYEACQQEVRRDLVIVTAGMSALACFVMGVAANLPFALAPGMGLNAYFTYTIVGFRGSGPVEYETALGVVFIEGIVFMVIAALGIRSFIVKAIPTCILRATTGGIGLFLATLGLQTAEGIGLIVSDTATGMTMGGCKPEHRVPMYACPSTKGIPGAHDGRPVLPHGLALPPGVTQGTLLCCACGLWPAPRVPSLGLRLHMFRVFANACSRMCARLGRRHRHGGTGHDRCVGRNLHQPRRLPRSRWQPGCVPVGGVPERHA
jgi:hypothetical protein